MPGSPIRRGVRNSFDDSSGGAAVALGVKNIDNSPFNLDSKNSLLLANVRNYGATKAQRLVIGNGAPKPLSGFYATLAAAQIDYPAAAALTDELDWAVGQKAIDSGLVAKVYWPTAFAAYVINRPYTFDSSKELFGDGKSATTGTTIQCTAAVFIFKPKTPTTVITRYVKIHDLWLYNSGVGNPVGSGGISFDGVLESSVEDVSIRYCETGILVSDSGTIGAGTENFFKNNEVAGNTSGYKFTAVGNANLVIGGLVRGNTIGVAMDTCNTVSLIGVTAESNSIAWRATAGTIDCSWTYSHFEGNTTAAILWVSTATGCREDFNEFAGATDRVIDESSGFNRSASLIVPSVAAAPTHMGNGQNLVPNAGMEIDNNADGIADGWSLSAALPANMTLSLDAAVFASGTKSQKWAVTGATAQRILSLPQLVKPFGEYVLTMRYLITAAGDFRFGIGTSPGVGSYESAVLDHVSGSGGFSYYRIGIVVGNVSAVYLWFQNINVATSTSLWIDDVKLEPGLSPTSRGPEDLAGANVTWGPDIASAASIAITHRQHHVTGMIPIDNVNFPNGFSGTTLLVMDDGAAFTAAGNIIRALVPAAGQPVVVARDPIKTKVYL